MKRLVAIGGADALKISQLRGRESKAPRGTTESETLPTRQHAWNEFLSRDEHGNPVLPRHHVLLYLDYDGTRPTAADRESVETALGTLERAYEWSNDGLLFTIGYSPAYFDRFEAAYLPSRVDLPDPTKLSPFDDPAFDEQDALIHLASDRAQVVLAAE